MNSPCRLMYSCTVIHILVREDYLKVGDIAVSKSTQQTIAHETIRVLMVDDHAIFRQGVRAILETHGQITVVGEADNGRSAMARYMLLTPDVVLMDIDMPKMGGIEATRTIKSANPTARIILLTESADPVSLFYAIKAGASGYVVKNVEPENLVDSILRVRSGEGVIPTNLALKVISEISISTWGYDGSDLHTLTKKEADVLRILGNGATNKEIARELHIAENTVRNHVRRVMEKLHAQNRAQAAALAMKAMKYEQNRDGGKMMGSTGRSNFILRG